MEGGAGACPPPAPLASAAFLAASILVMSPAATSGSLNVGGLRKG